MSPGLGVTAGATAGALGFIGATGLLEETGETWRFWFLLCMSLWEKGGEGMGGCGPGVCLSLTVSQENYTPATIVCEDALRSDHLIADMADNKTKIPQCWKLAVDKHLFFAELQGFAEAVKLFVSRVCVVNKT